MRDAGGTCVSVVVPLRDEAAVLEPFAREVLAVLRRECRHFEVVLVDDWSGDATAAAARRLARAHPEVRLVRLSRRFGPDVAILAGLETSIGDVVVVLRADSDPPREIPPLLKRAGEGWDVVWGVPENPPPAGLVFRLLRAAFYGTCNRLLRLDVPRMTPGMCAFTRRAVNAMARVKQKQRHLSLLGCGVGFAQTRVAYRKEYRIRPRSPGLLESFDKGISALVAQSNSPLRIIGYLGGFAGLLNLLYVLYVCGVNLFKSKVAEGWTTLSLQTAVMFFFMFLILVLMAEYISRIAEEARDRPLYHVLDEVTGPVLADPGLRNVLDHSPPGEEILGFREGGERRAS